MADQLPALLDRPETPAPASLGAADLVAAFLGGRKKSTVDGYRKDLADFARHSGQPNGQAAVEVLLALAPGPANGVVLGYRNAMTGRGLAPATVARRLAALRSVVKLARTLGRVTWSLDVESPRVQGYRDVRGPGAEGWKAMFAEAARAATTPKGRRDLATILLLRDNGLRRSEAVGLDLDDVDLDGPAISILGKGRAQKERVTINRRTAEALRAWIADRGDRPGPLLVRLDRAAGDGPPTRLDPSSVGLIVHAIGRRAGLTRGSNAHALRHESITRALDLCNGDVRKVRAFSRHRSIEVLMKYDDARRDDAGRIANLLGADDE